MALDPLATVGSVAAPIVGGIFGNLFSQGDKDKELALKQQALQQFLNLHPQLSSVNFNKYANQGQYNPLLENAQSQGQSQLNDIAVNPAYKQAALASLQQMQSIGNSGGMRIQDQSDLNNILNQTAAQNHGQQAAIQQNFAQRGMAGSGFNLAQQMLAQQAGANSANEQGTNIAAQAQNRALQALQSAGSLGNQMNSTDFQQKAQQAQAQDAINRFNTQNSQAVAQRNAASQNYGQQYNLGENQKIADQNTGLANQQQLQNNQYQQQLYQNQLSKAQGAAGATNNIANQYGQNAQDTAKTWGGVGQGIGQGFSQYNQDQAQDARWQGLTDALQNGKQKQATNDDYSQAFSYGNLA